MRESARLEGKMLEHVDNKNCQTRHVSGDLWECLAYKDIHCEFRMFYGPETYCLHKDHMAFTVHAHRNKQVLRSAKR